MSTAQQFQEAADKATQASSQAYTWAKGPINTFVQTDSGLVPTIAEFTRANQVRADNAINAIGWVLAGDFTVGCTVTGRNQYVLEVGGSAYRWDGSLPKTVLPGSSPSPEAAGSWVRILFTSDTPPLPDVWAPLSDSLRLITGYGRDVLVGSDVVARMVNFSRNSEAATVNKAGYLEPYLANAPRFTLKGLLGEPSSSNYITTSEGLSQIGTEAGASVVTENGVTLVSYAGIGGLSKDYSAPASSALTLSFHVRIGGAVGSTINVQMRDGPSVGFTASISVSAAGVLSVSNSDNILSSWGLETVSPSLVRAFAVIKPTTATVYRLFRGSPVAGETFGSLQLEPMPFATSYIKTTGAVTTRVADSAFLPSSGNRFYKPFFSVAFSWSVIGIRTDITDNRLIDFDNDASANRHYVGISQTGRLVAQFGTNRIVSSAPISGGVCVLVINGTTFSLYNNGVRIGSALVTGWSGSPNGKINLLCNNTGLFQSAGYIRDLKMWMSALTDAQAKAVK